MNLRQDLSSEKLDRIIEAGKGARNQVAARISDCLTRQEKEISDSIDYLASDAAQKSMAIDPYWPKWNSPWWHMTLLYEMGICDRIPYMSLELLSASFDRYLSFFPAKVEEIPDGYDPYGDILCPCALATAHRILLTRNIRIDRTHPWVRDWFVRYQLPDGGYNCDEAVYAKPNGKSSMISTIHMMESLIALPDLSAAEIGALDRAAFYLIERKLLRSLSKGDRVIDPDWILLTFPRYYEIDILRTLRCILRWAVVRNKSIPGSAIQEVTGLIHEKNSQQDLLHTEREFYNSCRTRIRNTDGGWQKQQPVTVFPLLVALGANKQPSPFLTQEWVDTLSDLETLRRGNQITF